MHTRPFTRKGILWCRPYNSRPALHLTMWGRPDLSSYLKVVEMHTQSSNWKRVIVMWGRKDGVRAFLRVSANQESGVATFAGR